MGDLTEKLIHVGYLFCFMAGTWTKNCCLIAFGGGYDLGFINALGQKGTHIIRDFVQQGGSYLGFCAGAYWACNYIEFDKGGSLEVVGERFLKFFPGNVWHLINELYTVFFFFAILIDRA